MAGAHICPTCSAKVPAGARFCQKCGAHMPAGGHQAAKSGWSQAKVLIAGALVLLVAAAATIIGIHSMNTKSMAADTAPSTASTMTSIDGAGPMPAWLTKAGTTMINDYAWAASHHNELQYFPCYCGCFDTAGHTSNSNCYFKRDGQGTITAYDQHAYG